MPASRLDARSVPVSKSDVVGQEAENADGFITHIGLASGEQLSLFRGEQASVSHMAPPFNNRGCMTSHAVGTAVLSSDELNQIDVFLSEIEYERLASSRQRLPWWQYTIHPHVSPRCSVDGTVLYYRFSCVGLVIESYRKAGINLVVDDEAGLPAVTAAEIDLAYPSLAPITAIDNRIRTDLGIPGEGHWKVMLAGYALHSLRRSPSDIRAKPHQPAIGECFYFGN